MLTSRDEAENESFFCFRLPWKVTLEVEKQLYWIILGKIQWLRWEESISILPFFLQNGKLCTGENFKKVVNLNSLKNSLRSLRIQVLICISACLFCFLVFLLLRTDYQGRTKKKEVKYKQIEADTLSPSFIPTFFFLDFFLQVIVNWALHCPRYLSDRFVHSLKIMLPSS